MYGIEVVYQGRDNNIELELRENGVNLVDYSPISRVKMTFDSSQSLDSNLNPQYFDWSGNRLAIKAGLAGLTAGRYKVKVESWDGHHPNGLVWTDDLRVEVRG